MRSDPPTGDELNRMLVSMKRNVLEQVADEPAQAPAPARRSRSFNRGLTFGIGLTALLGIGAGAAFAFGVATSDPAAEPAPQQLPPIATPSAEPTPSATPTPEPVYEAIPGQPASRFGLDCDTLVDPALVQALFSTPVSASDPIVTVSAAGSSIPIRTSIMAVGGTVCEWSNGVPSFDKGGHTEGYAGVTVAITPEPATGWNVRAAGYHTPQLLGESCDAQRSCRAADVTEDAWLSIEADVPVGSAIDAAAWSRLHDAVLTALLEAGPAAPPAFVEHTDYPGPAGCEALLPLEAVRLATANPDIEFGLDGGGGWSNWAEADFVAGNFGCGWSGGESFVFLDWVHDGRWAFERMLDAGVAEPVGVDGLEPGADAVTRCAPQAQGAPTACAVDFLVGSDWYNVRTPDPATAIALAEALLAQRAAQK